MADVDSLRYPVGPLQRVREPLDERGRDAYVSIIESTPGRVRSLVAPLSHRDLELTYRPGGWTIRQVVHHMPDSHMNAYIRMKLAATESLPAVRTYEEALWAELPEAKSGAVEMSLALLDALHARWGAFLRALPGADMRRAFMHPGWGEVTIDEAITMYAWHCRHHTAHIEGALARRA